MKSLTPPSARSFDGRSSVPADDPHHNAALRGASLAFRAPPPPPKPLVNIYSGSNGALAAATRAGTGQNKHVVRTSIALVQVQAPTTSSELPRTPVREVPLKRATSSSVETLRLSTKTNSSRQQSPSHIAATLAAARSTPVLSVGVPSITSTKGLSRARGQSISVSDRNDESSIPATTALVQLFESKYGYKDGKEEVEAMERAQNNSKTKDFHILPTQSQHTKNIVSPTPIRPSIALRLSSSALNDSVASLDIKDVASQNSVKGNEFKPQPSATAVVEVQVHKSPVTSRPPASIISKVPPALPPPRYTELPSSKDVPNNSQAPNILSRSGTGSSTSSYTSARDVLSRTSTLATPFTATSDKPIRPPPFTSQPFLNGRPRFPHRASSRPEIRYTTNRIVPQLTANSLANAMVASSIASSLASSRATSPIKSSSPFSHSHSRSRHLFVPPRLPSRAASPTKPMRHTLRKSSTQSDEDDHKKHHYLILKKHPNKHAEGDRKRWRDSITDLERKRYEGLWAANRGLLLGPSFAQDSSTLETTFDVRDCVHGLVVKDIWSRSQLAPNMLEEIWELVNIHEEGRLRRDEFVVGMWLVDQCLKGRKLPVSVGESVWESVRGLRGVKIKQGKGKR
ncbi:Increased rDNA silencing protein [Xylographa bjoerkii]|nr:Increased rDNA silencing protein [Xylographa bjoerkii]